MPLSTSLVYDCCGKGSPPFPCTTDHIHVSDRKVYYSPAVVTMWRGDTPVTPYTVVNNTQVHLPECDIPAQVTRALTLTPHPTWVPFVPFLNCVIHDREDWFCLYYIEC